MNTEHSDYLFRSPRLGFRRWRAADSEPFARLNADPKVMRFFPKARTRAESDESIRRFEEGFERYGYQFYAVDVLETGTFIGFIGLSRPHFEEDFTPCEEIGWRLHHDHWGKGYATEGARACLRHGFENLGFEKVYSFTARINTPSEAVMKRIGMSYERNFDHPLIEVGHRLREHVLYSIHAAPFV